MKAPTVDTGDILHLLRAARLAAEFKGPKYWVVRRRLSSTIAALEELAGSTRAPVVKGTDAYDVEVYPGGELFGYRLYKASVGDKPVHIARPLYVTEVDAYTAAKDTEEAFRRVS